MKVDLMHRKTNQGGWITVAVEGPPNTNFSINLTMKELVLLAALQHTLENPPGEDTTP